MKTNLCIECQKKKISIKKRSLCRRCYGKFQRDNRKGFPINPIHQFTMKTVENKEVHGEIEFIKSFFSHTNWLHHPALFRLGGVNYSPDFYDGERNIFIEVSGTRQAYHFNKDKYILFRKLFPKLNFEVRKPSGELLNEDSRDKEWEQTS